MSRISIHAPAQGFAIHEAIVGLLTAAIFAMAGALSLGLFLAS
jgi:hypothetical protein